MTRPFLSIVCCTRGRPDAVSHLLDSIYRCASDAQSIEVLFRIDDDDPTGPQTKATIDSFASQGRRVTLLSGPRRGPKYQAWVINELTDAALGDWVWAVEDEIEFQTPGFDVLLKARVSQLEDDSFLITCPDNNKFPVAPTNPLFGKKWARYFGTLFPADLPVHYDVWIGYVLRPINREVYFSGVQIRDIGARGAGVAPDAVAIRSASDRIYSPEEIDREWERARTMRREFHRYLYEEKVTNPFWRAGLFRMLHRKLSFVVSDIRYASCCWTETNTRVPRSYLRKAALLRLLLLVPRTVLRA
jgi:hypothetical protein